MSTELAISIVAVDAIPASPVASRRFEYPTVRCIATPTAHPSSEAWPAPDRASAPPVNPGRRVCKPRRLRPVASSRPARGAAEVDTAPRFAELQKRMTRIEAAANARAERSLVVVPSRTLDGSEEPAATSQAYEERLLCTLLELRDPNIRMVYVTSSAVATSTIDYYLSLLPRSVRRDARSRLTLSALGEGSARPLSEKLLDRPRVLQRLRRMIGGWPACHLVPYNTTSSERDLALALDIPMYGADPRHAYLGTKSGCRALFAQAGVPHPAGAQDITSAASAVDAIVELRAAKPELSRLVMKCNEGVSGRGNAIVDLTDVPAPGDPDEAHRIAERVGRLAPEDKGLAVAAFLARLEQHGGVIEEWITGRELESPSVQLQITPGGELRLLSTHDQILGGPSGQSYLGCRFPAASSYAPAISTLAVRVGERLADAGVIGRFAIDFVVARDEHSGWRPYAIELNLRKGGTTHPYETLAHLTSGIYDPDGSRFTTPTGQHKYYVATDHMEAEELRGLGRDGVLRLARRGELRFDPMRRTGTVFHMLSSVNDVGRTGFTAIADSAGEADALYARVQQTLIAEGARRPIPLSTRDDRDVATSR